MYFMLIFAFTSFAPSLNYNIVKSKIITNIILYYPFSISYFTFSHNATSMTFHQELQKEADYIQTDVEYMALQDESEFSQPLRSIDQMKSELGGFSTALTELDSKLNTARTLFMNVGKVSGDLLYHCFCYLLRFSHPPFP